MKTKYLLFASLLSFILMSCSTNKGMHLFILSGQSNMAGLDPEISFIPAIEAEFGKENILVVKDAQGGQPIRRWYKNWKASGENGPKAQGDLYDRLMIKVNDTIQNKELASVNFIWMQGERDAKEEHGDVYEKSLLGLHRQLSDDLNRQDINFIIGRLSDFDMTNSKYRHWQMVRAAQVAVAESNSQFGWVDTDDLNDGLNKRGKEIKNDLHMSVKGYHTMGERFAEKSIELINK
jgi:hypothetical protein